MTAEHLDGAVAVTGMACRFPGSSGPDQFWAALRAGTEGLSHFDRDRLVARGADPELVRRTDFVPTKGLLTGAENFDWTFFGYSRAEAANIDPQQRVLLECASAALDDAGIDPTRFPGWIGVYAGADKVSARADDHLSELSRFIGEEKDFLATRVAYKLGLRGPAITVQTACSTSLTAIHTAAQSLLGGECDAALAGGVAVTPAWEWGYLYEAGGILSPDGHCRPFDEHAAGTVPSDGVGVVVLKRLADALRDGDRIVAVIRGSALNNDGSDKIGYTAPSIPGQSEVIRYAQRVAGVDPADIDYVEAHGTGTRIGDPVEVRALTDVFGADTEATGWCALGAVKSNIGHTGAAAGVASFIKTALLLEHRELVPTVHFGRANPLLELERTPFRVCTRTEPWPDRGVAMAAVSSFGVGGTNAHLVMSAAPRRATTAGLPGPRILPVSAASPDALARLRADLADRLAEGPALPSVARTLTDRRAHSHRTAVVADDPADAAAALRAGSERATDRRLDRVAFLFPGQGTLRHPAAEAAHRLLSGFRTHFDDVAETVAKRHDVDITPVVSDEPVPGDWFADTVHQQLGLFAIGYALGRQLDEWGIRPAALVGNSIGEYAAAALAGVWTAADAASLVFERATAMWATEPGRMLAVDAPADRVAARIARFDGVVVGVAGTGGVVVSGPAAVVGDLLASDALAGFEVRPLTTLRAFHSALMDPAAAALREILADVPTGQPRLPIVSTRGGGWADPAALRTPAYWADQMREPVLLDAAAGTLLAAGCDTFVELGPGSSMLGTLRRHPQWTPTGDAVPLLGRPGDGERALLRALGTLWELGADTLPAEPVTTPRAALPPHPFAARNPRTTPAAPPPAHRQPVRTADGSVRSTLTRLWCTALGTGTVSDGDDFFALGGESLTAVHLVNQAARHAGATLSVAEFTATPTFGHLVSMVGDPRPEVPGVARLAAGAGRPVFLAADATGTTLGYRTLAGLLAADRPVVGLESGGDRIEDIAAAHLDAVLATQPDGPYTIGGWSFGATVAHELASRLTERGASVDVLLCLDGCTPDTRGRPVAAHPEYLLAGLRMGGGAALGVGPVGRRLRGSPALRRRFARNMAALLRYRPRPVDVPAVLFATRAGLRGATRYATVYRSLRIEPVSGDHWSMLTAPHAGDLAVRMRTALSDAATGENEDHGIR
jgi:phthiocerol/phenolphthiocerol synthesis type-I polyketide synthase E